MKIRTQYANITDEKGYLNTWKLYFDIQELEAKIRIIDMCLQHMAFIYRPKFGEILAGYGFRYEWNQGTPEYDSQLQAVEIQSKKWIVEHTQKKRRWDELREKSESNQPTRETFEDELLILSKEAGYHMRTTDVTAFQFARMAVAHRKKHTKKPR